MLKCVDCGKSGGIALADGAYVVSCEEKGKIRIGEMFAGNFKCDGWIPEPLTPLPDNVRVILSCGRDVTTWDGAVRDVSDLEGMVGDGDGFIRVGRLVLRVDEIAALIYEEQP